MPKSITRGNKTYTVVKVFFGDPELSDDEIDAIEEQDAIELELNMEDENCEHED